MKSFKGKCYALFAVTIIFIATPVHAEQTLKEFLAVTTHPEFEDYKVKKTSFTSVKNIDLSSHKNANLLRTRLRKGFNEEANYADEYVVISIPCGIACLSKWIVSKKTGKILTDVAASQGATFQLDSSLFVTGYDPSIHNDMPKEVLGKIFGDGKIRYYAIERNQFTLIKTIDPNQKEQTN